MQLSTLRLVLIGLLVATLSVTLRAQDQHVLFAQSDNGIPAYPEPVSYRQPDGSLLTVTLKGDAAIRWAETPDGYKILQNPDGFYYYAVEDMAKGMVASTVRVSEAGIRSESERKFVSTLNPSVFFSSSYIQQRLSSRLGMLKSAGTPAKAFPTKGNRKLIAILVNFSDVKMTRNNNDFYRLFNEKGYSVNGASGSVADYFNDNSFGSMSLTVDVAGPYTVSNSMAYYGQNANDFDQNPRDMVREAVMLANPDVDFSQYDNDKDGVIDGVYIIFAGYGEEAGASAEAIWSHAWSISPVTLDGVKVSSYSCSPELLGNEKSNTTGRITNIGVITHEFLHVCGLPDFYDTDYEKSGGEAPALGKYDVMSSGSWNNSGKTPPFVNSYCRSMLGWGTLSAFTPKKTNTLLPHSQSQVAYIVGDKNTECYVFENRQKTKWDSYIPGKGMVAYHIVYDQQRWYQNTINTDPSKELFDLVDAALPASSAYSPFPGASGKTEFTSATSPAFAKWSGVSFNMPLINITETADGTITVDAKTIQYATFKVTESDKPSLESSVTVDGVTLKTNAQGVANASVSLLGSRTFQVAKPGFTPYTGQLISSNDTVISVKLNRLVTNRYVKVVNGKKPLPDITIKFPDGTLTTDSKGLINLPVIYTSPITVYVETPNKVSTFSMPFSVDATSDTTTISLKNIIVATKSRIGNPDILTVSIPDFGSIAISKGASMHSFYIPMSSSAIKYTTNFTNQQQLNGETKLLGNTVDTLWLNYNAYKVFTLQAKQSVPWVEVGTSLNSSFTSNSDGYFIVNVPVGLPEIQLTVSTAKYHQTTTTLNNLAYASTDFFVDLVLARDESGFTIAPNPTTLPLKIYSKASEATLYIYTIQGNLIHTQKLGIGLNEITAAKLSAGTYIAKIDVNSQKVTKKFIVL